MKLKKVDVYILYLIILLFMIKDLVINNNFINSILCVFFMFSLTILKIFKNVNLFDKRFIIKNFFIFVFLAIQLIIIVLFKFNVSSISIYLNICFYLFTIYLFFDEYKKDFNKFIKFIIMINLIVNFISLIFIGLSYLNIFNINLFFNKKFLFGLYINYNSVGITTLISLILYLNYIFKPKKIFSYIYILFSIFIIIVSECRTALYTFIIYIILVLILKIFKKKLKFIITIFNVLFVVFVFSYLCIIYAYKDNKDFNIIEKKIDNFTTHRYLLSKYSLLSLEKNIYFGINNESISSMRYKIIPNKIKKKYNSGTTLELIKSNNNNHNSYVDIIVNQGILIFLLFLFFIITNFYKTKEKNLPILYSILVISFFETSLLITKNMVMLVFIFLLSNKNIIEDNKNQKNQSLKSLNNKE